MRVEARRARSIAGSRAAGVGDREPLGPGSRPGGGARVELRPDGPGRRPVRARRAAARPGRSHRDLRGRADRQRAATQANLTQANLTLAGTAGGTTLDGRLAFAGTPAEWRAADLKLDLTASAADGGKLIGQFALPVLRSRRTAPAR